MIALNFVFLICSIITIWTHQTILSSLGRLFILQTLATNIITLADKNFGCYKNKRLKTFFSNLLRLNSLTLKIILLSWMT